MLIQHERVCEGLVSTVRESVGKPVFPENSFKTQVHR